MLRVPRPQTGRWRLVSAQWAPRNRAQQLTEGALARCCLACHDKARAGHAALLAAIGRGEVAGRLHPRYGWATRWHTRDGRPHATAGRGGDQGRNVTKTVSALAERGLAVRSRCPGLDGDYPYAITEAGLAALQDAQAGQRRPAGRPDGLPANRDGSLSRRRTSEEEKRDAGVMTTPQRAEHDRLRSLDHPRPATRIRERLPDDEWTTVPAAAADPSWPSDVQAGVAAAARRPSALSRVLPGLPSGSRQSARR